MKKKLLLFRRKQGGRGQLKISECFVCKAEMMKKVVDAVMESLWHCKRNYKCKHGDNCLEEVLIEIYNTLQVKRRIK